jgi:glycogen debranching enzyme
MPQAFVRRDLLYAWKGSSLLIVTPRGDCDGSHPLCGFYYREARYLNTSVVTINGVRPWLCEAAAVAPDHLEFSYTYPEITRYGGGGTGQSGDDSPRDADGLPQRGLDLRVALRVGIGRLEAAAALVNRSREAVTFDIEWALGADFADIQEAQGSQRQQHAAIDARVSAAALEFRYEHPALHYSTSVRVPCAGNWRITENGIGARITLQPHATLDLPLRIDAIDGVAMEDAERAAREQAADAWRRRFVHVEAAGNRQFEAALASNVRDIASFPLLEGLRDEWLTPQAGMPLYPAFFGRDAVTAGWQAAMIDRGDLLDASLARLGRLQSTRVDDWHDEQPGRIPYQVRDGPLARLDINPYAAYYADYASPLMYVIALANLCAWTGDEARVSRHWDTARRILDWARTDGDADRDGYLEYLTRSSGGTKNQGWKDSGDAIVYDDGSPVPAPIATCEVQGYWYLAQLLMGLLCALRGSWGDARAHVTAASELKARFNRDWWMPAQGSFALALDPEKRPVPAMTSNVGHCLACGIIDAAHIPQVVGRLFAPDMFSGWGIRTLSSDHAFYDPVSYHRGSVWAVEQATIVFGLRRFGFDARAQDLATAMFELSQLYSEYRIPETLGGYSRSERPTPGAYPQANTPQLWNASAFPLILQSLLGLVPFAPYHLLLLDPALPPWLPEITVSRLRIGTASVTIRFRRNADGRSTFEVLDQRGPLHVIRQPSPESLTASAGDRLHAFVETLLR